MNYSLIENNINQNEININQNISYENIILKKINKKNNLLFHYFYKTVSLEKEKIDSLENSENWDKLKKIGNPYELIYTTYNKKRKNDSISSYSPISRSYFKMWEMFYNFDFFKHFTPNERYIFAHLAEGPGGFMEASYNYRYKILSCKNPLAKPKLNDIFYGITLKPTNDYIPDWNKLKKNFANKENIKIEYGNLYILNDVKNYIQKFSKDKAYLVTADGGFDYSSNFNGQEINSCQIIYSECIIALNVLRWNGCFVCKIFDIFTITMIQILYILSGSFENVYIYKPETSRPANSEKYIVCMYYKDNLTQEMKKSLLKNIELWNNITHILSPDESIIFDNIKINNEFIQKLNSYNQKYIDLQMFFLKNTIILAQKKLEKDEYYEIIQNQVNKAIAWCDKYDIPINKNSIYYKKGT